MRGLGLDDLSSTFLLDQSNITRVLFLMLGVQSLSKSLEKEGFRGRPLLDIQASQQFLVSSHVRERDKGLLRGTLTGLGHVRGEIVPYWFCGFVDGDGLFWDCPYPPLVFLREFL